MTLEIIGWFVTILAVWGVVLNNRHNRLCFKLWLVSNFLSCAIHIIVGVWSLAARDAVFFVLAVEGLILWSKQNK